MATDAMRHPEDVETGQEITVEYEPTNSRELQTVTGTITEIENKTPNIEEEWYRIYFHTDDVDRRDCYGDDANRRIAFMMGGYEELEGKNGARWNQLSAAVGIDAVSFD